jgi:hypothetical protein
VICHSWGRLHNKNKNNGNMCRICKHNQFSVCEIERCTRGTHAPTKLYFLQRRDILLLHHAINHLQVEHGMGQLRILQQKLPGLGGVVLRERMHL